MHIACWDRKDLVQVNPNLPNGNMKTQRTECVCEVGVDMSEINMYEFQASAKISEMTKPRSS